MKNDSPGLGLVRVTVEAAISSLALVLILFLLPLGNIRWIPILTWVCYTLLRAFASSFKPVLMLLTINVLLIVLLMAGLRVAARLIWSPPIDFGSVRFWWLSHLYPAETSLHFPALVIGIIAVAVAIARLSARLTTLLTSRRLQWSMVICALILGTANLGHYLRPVNCWDCFFPYGVPFTFFTEGGYAGGGGIVWFGLWADFSIAMVLAFVLAMILSRAAHDRNTS